MKQRMLCAILGSAAIILSLAACGGGGYSSGGGSSGGGGSGGSGSAAVTITPTSSTIAINATQQFVASTPGSDSGTTYTWKSSDINVATVDNNGLATGIAAGTTNITVTSRYSISGYTYTATSDPAVLTVSASGMVMGTAAIGRPLVAALVSLRDAQGQTQFTITNAQGHFAIAISGLVAPFLLKVADGQGHVMYSLGSTAGVINIDPFSDVIARSLFQKQGNSIEFAFANTDKQLHVDAATLQKLDRDLVNALTDSLHAHGVNPERFSLLHTPFTADGSGLDAVLDHTHLTQQNGIFLIRNDATGDSISLQASGHDIMVRLLRQAAH